MFIGYFVLLFIIGLIIVVVIGTLKIIKDKAFAAIMTFLMLTAVIVTLGVCFWYTVEPTGKTYEILNSEYYLASDKHGTHYEVAYIDDNEDIHHTSIDKKADRASLNAGEKPYVEVVHKRFLCFYTTDVIVHININKGE